MSLTKESVQKIVASWLETTSKVLNLNLTKSFELITSVKTLQTIREEAFKVETIDNWEIICGETYLPNKFTVWHFFFQHLVSKRAETLICHKIDTNLSYLHNKLEDVFRSSSNEKTENNLRWYVWNEDADDLSKDKIEHPGKIFSFVLKIIIEKNWAVMFVLIIWYKPVAFFLFLSFTKI